MLNIHISIDVFGIVNDKCILCARQNDKLLQLSMSMTLTCELQRQMIQLAVATETANSSCLTLAICSYAVRSRPLCRSLRRTVFVFVTHLSMSARCENLVLANEC